MELSKGQKSGVAVLAIALVALIVDRAFLGGGSGPDEASASSNETSVEPMPEAADPLDPNSESPTVALAQRLESLWSERDPDISQARGIFSLPASWLANVRPATSADRPPSVQDAITMFRTNYQLRGVLMTGRAHGVVTVNDHVLRLGDDLDGFKLIAIEEESATFEADGRQVSLMLITDL